MKPCATDRSGVHGVGAALALAAGLGCASTSVTGASAYQGYLPRPRSAGYDRPAFPPPGPARPVA